jgi:RHH-type proline utilization regulon transcriptional repressor/proline dehydrogenase/delta 1-pyrroline-5-carboxylate dehydrogenase
MAELRIGDPADLATDVGPVIDAEAKAMLLNYLGTPGTPLGSGYFVAPELLEISLDTLPKAEIFGPILHILRWQEGTLPTLIDRLNGLGYGLTHGIHSRIDDTIELITNRIHAGNIYVNRNIVGAVVGVQPFGGEGLSGTGPKAGGPLILHRLVRNSRPATPPLTTLPGPTGERNTLSLLPRGAVFCDAATPEERARQEQAARAVGCSIAAESARPDAVLTDATGASLAALCQRLATMEGPIIPVITPDEYGYPTWRLLHERCVSTNTAAAGGNAELMGSVL